VPFAGAALRSEVPAQAALPALLVRHTVRELLLSSAAFHALDAGKRREVAEALVKVCQTAATLLAEEAKSTEPAASVASAPDRTRAVQPTPASAGPLAMAQNAGQEFSGVSAQKVASTTRAILNAVSFPRFVTELINGVFKALVDSNQQQMQGFVELIKNVAATTEGFADANLAPDRARQWLVETFPGSFTIEGGPDEDADPRDVAEEAQQSTVRLKQGASLPTEPALRTALGIAPGETIPSGDPERALVPFARRALARQRQQMLATMVMLGMQRIVIESGRLNASMRFHIDTRSTANAEAGSRFDLENKAEAEGKFGAGPWGVSAKMTNTIGYVSTQKTQSNEEMNTDLDLNSSVELYFKTDYLPLDRLAGPGQVDRIKVNTLNPDAEEKAALQSREQRVAGARKAESERASQLNESLKHATAPSQPKEPPPKAAAAAPKAADPTPKPAAPKPAAGGAPNSKGGSTPAPAPAPSKGSAKR
jgi:hypothetical protein